MVLLTSSGALGGMHVKLANGLIRHNWRANALIGDGLHWDNRIDPRKSLSVDRSLGWIVGHS